MSHTSWSIGSIQLERVPYFDVGLDSEGIDVSRDAMALDWADPWLTDDQPTVAIPHASGLRVGPPTINSYLPSLYGILVGFALTDRVRARISSWTGAAQLSVGLGQLHAGELDGNLAASTGQTLVVKELIRHSVDVNFLDRWDNPPLVDAVRSPACKPAAVASLMAVASLRGEVVRGDVVRGDVVNRTRPARNTPGTRGD